MRYGRLIKFIRMELKLSRKEMAKLMKVKLNFIYAVESGRSRVGYRTLVKLSRATQIPLSLLVGEESVLILGGEADTGRFYEAIRERLIYINDLMKKAEAAEC